MAKSEWIGRREPTPHSAFSIQHSALRAFTLVEMVIVIGIIILLAGLVLPAASQMWRDRKLADAQNMVSGMLMVARAKALEGNAGETGLFFYLDDQGVQHVAAISQDPGDPANTTWQTESRWHNVFTVSENRTYTLPAPMRVVPRNAVCGEAGSGTACDGYDEKYELFSSDELANNDFANAKIDADHQVGQMHRNYFTIIYSPDGELKVARDVLIRDVDADCNENPGGGGDVTGLHVGTTDCSVPNVMQYYKQDQNNTPDNICPKNPPQPVDYLVTNSDIAINFPSVDGLLVYDDSLFNEAGDAEARRKFLLESAQPFYIQRLTGAVVRGPVGEVPATP